MTVAKIENGLECGFVKHRLNCLLITDPVFLCGLDHTFLTGVLNKVAQFDTLHSFYGDKVRLWCAGLLFIALLIVFIVQ